MLWIKRISVIVLIVGGIIFLGKMAPNIGTQKAVSLLKKLNFSSGVHADSSQPEMKQTVADSADFFPWKLALRDSLFLRYDLDDRYLSKRDSSHWLLYMPRGKSLLSYALELKFLCRSMGIEIVRGRVTSSSVTTFQQYLVRNQDSLILDTRYARSYLKNRAEFSLLFHMPDSLTPNEIKKLNSFSFPLSLIVNPNADLSWLRQLEEREDRDVICLVAMEPFDYPLRNPGDGTLLLHHPEEKIRKLLEEKLKKVPTAKGFASYYGQRAIENKKWLKTMLLQLKEVSPLFLDLTGSQRSYTEPGCREVDLNCRRGYIQTGARLKQELQRKKTTAYRYGEAFVVARWSLENAKIISDLLQEKEIEANGLKMIKFSQMEHY